MFRVGLFAGQGNQYVGMAKDLYGESKDVRQLYDLATRRTGITAKLISFYGPDEKQTPTENQQLIIGLHSLAMYRELEKRVDENYFDVLSGHSLGSITAAATAHIIPDDEKFIDILATRGKLMGEVKYDQPNPLMSIVYRGDIDDLQQKLAQAREQEGLKVYLSLVNFPGGVVLGGDPSHLVGFSQKYNLKGRGVDVSGDFHTPSFTDQGLRFMDYLFKYIGDFQEPNTPVISNIDGSYVDKINFAYDASNLLCSPVRFDLVIEQIIKMAGSDDIEFVEIGPGSAISKMLKRMKREGDTTVTLDTLADLNKYKPRWA